MVTLGDIKDARTRVGSDVHRTPLAFSRTFSELLGEHLYLKQECLQKTGSFKPRGALNKLRQLTPEERQRGVITVSAGNHAQSLAYGARISHVRATVVMPANASQGKAEAARAYGAEVVLHGDVKAAFARCLDLQRERGLTLVHPFDDPAIIAGQGTVGLEILEDLPDADLVIVGIGGGGLISGIATAIKEQRPRCRVVGVEPEGAAAMARSLEARRVVRLETVDTIADGLGAPFAGELTLAHVQRYVDDVVLVSDEEIVKAVRLLLERCKLLVEPAGAAALAALLSGKVTPPPGGRTVAVLSGGNIDLPRLKSIL